MGPAEQAEVLLRPHVEAAGCELFDVEWRPGLLRVSIDRPGGIDLEVIADLSPVLSRALDDADPEPVPGRYTLEVSSPGLERPLRTPSHFKRFVGTKVSVKTRDEVDGERRFTGVLEDADPDTAGGISVAGRRLPYDQIDRARTVFEWGAPPKPKNANPKKPQGSRKK
jgi:ribosome maturation factor RimP